MLTLIIRAGFTIALLLLIYLGIWAGTAVLVFQQAEGWMESLQLDGLQVRHDEPFFGGFPEKVTITYPELKVTSGNLPADWSWNTQAVSISARPLLVKQLSIDLSGAHSVTTLGTPIPVLNLGAADSKLDLEFDSSGTISSADLTVSKATATWPSEGTHIFEVGEANFSIQRLVPIPQRSKISNLEIRIHDLHLPAITPAPFDPTIKKVSFIARTPMPNFGQSLSASLKAWADTGDVIEFREMEVVWPPFTISATGIATLDERLQPAGAFSAKIQGFFEVLNILVTNGAVRSRDASMARIVLGLLTRSPPGGGPPELSTSITAQDGKLYAGPVMLMDLPMIVWPGEATER
jgi:hypothetical protein